MRHEDFGMREGIGPLAGWTAIAGSSRMGVSGVVGVPAGAAKEV